MPNDVVPVVPPALQPEPVAASVPDDDGPKLARGERLRPPNRRRSETVTISLGGHEAHFIVGFRPDGKPCDVFIDTGKDGTGIRGWAGALSLVVSHYVQIGGDLTVIADALRHTCFAPDGPVAGEPLGIANATSMVDAFAQFLAHIAEGSP